MLEAARASPLSAWIARIGPDASVHAMELGDARPLARAGCRDRGVDAVGVARLDRVVRPAGRPAGAAASRAWRRGAALALGRSAACRIGRRSRTPRAGPRGAPHRRQRRPGSYRRDLARRMGSAVARPEGTHVAAARDRPPARRACEGVPRSVGRPTAGRCGGRCTPVCRGSSAARPSIRPRRSSSSRSPRWISSACAARSCAVSHFRGCRSPHDPSATCALVRAARRARRCHAGARGARAHRGGRARSAADGGAACRTRGHPSAAPAVRGAVAALPRLLAGRSLPGLGVPRAAGNDARALPRPHSRLGGGRRARDPAAAARRIGARGARALAPRARRDGHVERRLRADGRCRSAGARAAVRVSARHRARVPAGPADSTLRRRRLAARARGGHGRGTAAARAAGHRAQGPGARNAVVAAHGHGAQRGVRGGQGRRARARGRRAARATRGAARSPRAAHRALRRRAAAVGAAERPRAGVGEPVLLDHGLDERARRSSAGERPRPIGCARDPAPSAAAAGRQGAAAARQSLVGAAVRGLQPRARHAVAERGRPERAARDRRAADVRLHVRRPRPGARHRRRRLRVAEALAARAPVRRRRHCRDRRSARCSAACSACTCCTRSGSRRSTIR